MGEYFAFVAGGCYKIRAPRFLQGLVLHLHKKGLPFPYEYDGLFSDN